MTDALRYREIPPPAPIAPFVRCIWRLHGVSDGAPEPIIPDGCAELIINVGERFTRQMSPDASYRQPQRFVVGQITRAVTVAPSRRVDVWGIRFHPWSAASLFGIPAHEMRDREVLLSDLSRPLDGALERLEDEHDDLGAERRLVGTLTSVAKRIAHPAMSVPGLITFVARNSETMPVSRLAREAGIGARRLQAIFREHVGLSPKQLLRVTRFQRALRLARELPAASWSVVAHRAGYYDQAHLIRESNEIAGCTPSALVRREAPLTEVFLSDE